MIPKNINREHILKAIDEIRKSGIPQGRESKKFLIESNGEHYPPKYIISLANKYVNGEELQPSKFSGGNESNNFLTALGFRIIPEKLSIKVSQPTLRKHKKTVLPVAHQGERCRKCKETVKELLQRIYGKVEQNYQFQIGTHLEDFSNASRYSELKQIYKALEDYRGLKDFVRTKTLPNCDFFVPNPGLIVEFDESQHFTVARKIALELYPNKMGIGFSTKKWIELCEKINAKDNYPPYRDEQRAWYDTLRDFLPEIKSLNPTIRLFARDFSWCSLNPNNTSDVQRFSRFLQKNSESWEIEVIDEPNPFLSRIIIAGKWDGDPKRLRHFLEMFVLSGQRTRKLNS